MRVLDTWLWGNFYLIIQCLCNYCLNFMWVHTKAEQARSFKIININYFFLFTHLFFSFHNILSLIEFWDKFPSKTVYDKWSIPRHLNSQKKWCYKIQRRNISLWDCWIPWPWTKWLQWQWQYGINDITEKHAY